MNKLFLVSCLLFLSTQAQTALWQDTMAHYANLQASLKKQFTAHELNQHASTYWNSQRAILHHILSSPFNANLWHEKFLHQNMIRGGRSQAQNFELCFISYCLSDSIKKLILSYKDVNLSGVSQECPELACSTNTLGHLFYVGKILEKAQSNTIKINTICEFGAGYGNLARIFKSLLPAATIILLDLPEFLALQYYFLKLTLPDAHIILHAEKPVLFQAQAIHLVPVYFAHQLEYKTDLFVSTFALSEAPHYTQHIIANKKFFNASCVYLTGQLNRGTEVMMEHHEFLLNNLRKLYNKVDCQPFYNLFEALPSYEIITVKS